MAIIGIKMSCVPSEKFCFCSVVLLAFFFNTSVVIKIKYFLSGLTDSKVAIFVVSYLKFHIFSYFVFV